MRLVAIAGVVASFGAVAGIGACLYSVPDVDDSVVTADGGGDGSIIDSGFTDGDADAASFVDAAPEYIDISAGAGPSSGLFPSLAIDVVNGKLLVATDVATDDGSISGKAGLFRCNLDGTSCAYLDISRGAAGSGEFPSLAIDAANGKLLVATEDSSNGYTAGLFRCNLDGTSCAYLDISADAGGYSGLRPSLAIDAANGKLLVATEDSSNGYRAGLFRCNLDGTSCAHFDISADAGAGEVGLSPSLAIDAANGKLLVATTDYSNSEKPALFGCNLDGTSCAHLDISAGAGANSGVSPSLAIDAANGKLLVATQDGSNGNKPGLFRCNLDGTFCAHLDIAANAGSGSGEFPSLAIDAANGKLLVATTDDSNNDKPGLFRCNLDGTSCVYLDISAGAGANSGKSPSLAIDPATGEIVVATDDGSNNDRPALFLLR